MDLPKTECTGNKRTITITPNVWRWIFSFINYCCYTCHLSLSYCYQKPPPLQLASDVCKPTTPWTLEISLSCRRKMMSLCNMNKSPIELEKKPATSNGLPILLNSKTYTISRPELLLNLQLLLSSATKQRLIAKRACSAYLASISRPALFYEFAICSQNRHSTPTTITIINNTIVCAHKHHTRCLRYRPLKIYTCYLAVFCGRKLCQQ